MVRLNIFVLLVAVMAVSCVRRVENKTSQPVSAVTEELELMIQESQRLRSDDTVSYAIVAEADRHHRERVYQMLTRSMITEPPNLYHAAFLLQLADPNTCRDCYLIAHNLARRAADLGYEPARYLSATTLDRYLIFAGELQKYGTQYKTDSLGQTSLYPIDTLTTDSERATWNIPPLDSILSRFKKKP